MINCADFWYHFLVKVKILTKVVRKLYSNPIGFIWLICVVNCSELVRDYGCVKVKVCGKWVQYHISQYFVMPALRVMCSCNIDD